LSKVAEVLGAHKLLHGARPGSRQQHQVNSFGYAALRPANLEQRSYLSQNGMASNLCRHARPEIPETFLDE
jgi:hypothetical protein